MISHRRPALLFLSLVLMSSFALVAQKEGAPEQVSPAAVVESQKKARIEFRLAEESAAPGLTPIKTSDYVGTIYLHAEVELTNQDLKSATASQGQFGQPIVALVLTDAGFLKLKQLASANLRKRLAILIDGELLIAPLISAQITEPTVTIDGNFTVEEAQRLASALSPRFTHLQGQYLAFLDTYTKVTGRPPAEADFQRYFKVPPPTVHQMILTLDRLGLITRSPGKARSIRLNVPSEVLPRLE